MPASPNLPTNNVTGTGTPAADSNIAHAVLNIIYKANIGVTRTAAYTLTQANSGETIPVNVSSAVAITVPVLEAGTSVELLQLGTGNFSLTASGITFVLPTGSTAAPRVQGSVVSLLWLTTTLVLLGGDLA